MHLHMTEISARDWPAAVAWYRDVLGLPVLIRDDARRFAMLGGEGGRIALKEGGAEGPGVGTRLVFQVEDLEDARDRLASAGVSATEVVVDSHEHFRSFRLVGPDRISITIFAWDQAEISGRT